MGCKELVGCMRNDCRHHWLQLARWTAQADLHHLPSCTGDAPALPPTQPAAQPLAAPGRRQPPPGAPGRRAGLCAGSRRAEGTAKHVLWRDTPSICRKARLRAHWLPHWASPCPAPPASALSSCIWCSAASRMRSDCSSTSNLGVGRGAQYVCDGCNREPISSCNWATESDSPSKHTSPPGPGEPGQAPHLPCAALTASCAAALSASTAAALSPAAAARAAATASSWAARAAAARRAASASCRFSTRFSSALWASTRRCARTRPDEVVQV